MSGQIGIYAGDAALQKAEKAAEAVGGFVCDVGERVRGTGPAYAAYNADAKRPHRTGIEVEPQPLEIVRDFRKVTPPQEWWDFPEDQLYVTNEGEIIPQQAPEG